MLLFASSNRVWVQDASALVDAHDDRKSDAVFLMFRGGGSMTIPRHAIPGLERQPASVLEAMNEGEGGRGAAKWRQGWTTA